MWNIVKQTCIYPPKVPNVAIYLYISNVHH